MSLDPRGRAGAALRAAATVVALGGVRRAGADVPTDLVFEAGQDAVVASMLKGRGDALPGGCVWAGASIDAAGVHARFRCTGSDRDLLVDLVHPATAPASAPRTRQFALVAGPDASDDLIRALATRVSDNESALRWSSPQRAPRTSSPSTPVDRRLREVGVRAAGTYAAAMGVAAALAVVAAALLVVSRTYRRAPAQRAPLPEAERRVSPLAWLVALAAVVQTAISASRFAFRQDDFAYLVRAADDPWAREESLRVLTTTVPYWLCHAVGDRPIVLASLGVAALLGWLATWAWLLRRAGLSRSDTVLATSMLALTPGPAELLRWGAGFQQLAAMVVVVAVLAVTEAYASLLASPSRSRVDTALVWFGAMALVAAGVFMKFPVVAIAPPTIVVWWFVRGGRPRLAERAGFALAAGLAFGAPFLLAQVGYDGGTELTKLGASRVAENLGVAASAVARSAIAVVAGLTFLAVATVARAVASPAGDLGVNGLVARARVAMVEVGVALRAGAAATIGLRPSWLAFGALALVWLAPFLLNRLYFAPYYVTLASAPLLALSARSMGRVAELRPSLLTALLAAVALGLLLSPPWPPSGSTESHVERLREQLRASAEGRAAPERVVLIASCVDHDAAGPATRAMTAALTTKDELTGIRWATRWHAIAIDRSDDAAACDRDAPSELRVLYCADEPARLEWCRRGDAGPSEGQPGSGRSSSPP